ncbi:MAG: CotH kinase family protein [Clostridia bacterium]|nr:CotH kinase family protein [Clostridia bacterium]
MSKMKNNRGFTRLIRKLLLLGLAGALCLAVPAPARAEVRKDVRLADPATGAEIRGYYREKKNEYTFFLPSGLSADALQLLLPDGLPISLDGQPLQNGDSAAGFTVGEQHQLSDGRRSYGCTLMQSANIASLFLTTESGSNAYVNRRKGNAETGTFAYYLPTGRMAAGGNLEHIRGRGHASFQYDKKSYQIKLEKKTSLGGMEKAKKWVLVGNPLDRSLLRNKITFDMARAAGLTVTSESEFVDLYMNGEYRGTYLLIEKVEIGKGRVDIRDLEKATEQANGVNKLDVYRRIGNNKYKRNAKKYYDIPVDPDDITGGYLIEYEGYNWRYSDAESAIGTRRGAALTIKSPKYTSAAQMAYISDLLQRFEDAINTEEGIDPASGMHYTQLADLDSLVRRYLVEEISKNYDGNSSSQYFYKPADSQSNLLYGGPAWDYDSSYGSYATRKGAAVLKPAGFYVNASSQWQHWWPALYRQPDFAEASASIYRQVFAPLLDELLGRADPVHLRSLEQLERHIAASATMNFTRWPIDYVKNSAGIKLATTHAGNVDILADFIAQRKQFLDEAWAE